jgi:hypothetical protein
LAYGAAGGVLYNSTIPFADGLNVNFTQYQYGSDYPADGIGFDMASAPPIATSVGNNGGSLGYVNLLGGYLGIGLDVFGNFTGAGTSDPGCTQPSWATESANQSLGWHPNTVSVRGPGNAAAETGYCLLTSNLAPPGGSTGGLGEDLTTLNASDQLQGQTAGTTDMARTAAARQVHIVINPAAGTFSVSVDFTGTGTDYTPVITNATLPEPYPSRVTFGFASSTGDADDVHDVSDVAISTLNAAASTLSLVTTDSGNGSLPLGSPASYTLQAGVSGVSQGSEAEPVTVTDPLPAGVTLNGTPSGTGWNCSATAGSTVSCTLTPPGGSAAAGTAFSPITVPVTVNSADALGSSIVNTATATSSDAVNQVTGTDTATVVTPPPVSTTVAGPTGSVRRTGYRDVAGDGGVFCFGTDLFYGSIPGLSSQIAAAVRDIVGISSTADNAGYWLVGSDGGIFTFGDAHFYGSLPADKVSVHNIVDIALTPDGKGYWLVGSDGGVFSFGDAGFFGSLPELHIGAKEIDGVAPTPDGKGYWLVGSDGAVYPFGDAHYYGSELGQTLNAPIKSIAATGDGKGYWIVGSDGGVFAFGDAPFEGRAAAGSLAVVGIAHTQTGAGYWLAQVNGGSLHFGDAANLGNATRFQLNAPMTNEGD